MRRPSSEGVSAAGQRFADPHVVAGARHDLPGMLVAAWITFAAADPAQNATAQTDAAIKHQYLGSNATVPPAVTTPPENDIVSQSGRQGPAAPY